MKCPICGTDGAYVGLRDVKCICITCRAYDEGYSIEEQNVVLTPAPPSPVDFSDFMIHQGLRTRYAKKVLNKDFYSTVSIADIVKKWEPLLPEDDRRVVKELTAVMLEAFAKRFSAMSDEIYKNTERKP